MFNETANEAQAGVMGEIVSVETFTGGNQNIYVYDAGNFYRIKNLNASDYKAEVGKFVAFVGIKDGTDLTFKNVTVSEETVYEIAEQPKFEAKEYSTVGSVGTNYVGTMTDAVITAITEEGWTVTYNGSTYTLEVRGDNLAEVQKQLDGAEVGGKITAKVTKNFDHYYLLDAASITYTPLVKVAYTGTVQALASETGLTSSVEGDTLSITAGEIVLVDGSYVISVDVNKPENLTTLDNVKLTNPGAGLTLVKGTDKVTLNYTFTTTPTTGFTANINWNYDAKADQVINVTVSEAVTYESGEVATENEVELVTLADWASTSFDESADLTSKANINKVVEKYKAVDGFTNVFSNMTVEGSYVATNSDANTLRVNSSKKHDAKVTFTMHEGITITSVDVYFVAWRDDTGTITIGESSIESEQNVNGEKFYTPISFTDLSITNTLEISVNEGRGFIAGFNITYTAA